MRAIISTVGTSLLVNCRRKLSLDPEMIQKADVLEWMSATPESEISAEVNALSRMELLKERDHLYFLHSDTDFGRNCALLLVEHFRTTGYVAESIIVKGVSFNTGQFRDFGMANIVRETLRISRQYDNSAVVNITGGFKAEAGYALLAGLLARVPVVYLHEEMKKLVELPPMPIGFDKALYDDFADEIESIVEESNARSAQLAISRMPIHVQVLLEKSDAGYFAASGKPYKLSPVGIALRESDVSEAEAAQDISVRSGKRGAHSTRYGDGVQSLSDIPGDVKTLLKDVAALLGTREFQLTRFGNMPRSSCCYGTRVKKHATGVQFDVVSNDGWQTVVLPCPQEETEAIEAKLHKLFACFHTKED